VRVCFALIKLEHLMVGNDSVNNIFYLLFNFFLSIC